VAEPALEGVRLIVFAKLPIPGEVKTRLGEAVGIERAAAIYRAWVPTFIETLLELGDRVSIEVCVAPPNEVYPTPEEIVERARRWLPYPVDFALQVGVDLREKLRNAFDRSFKAGWAAVLVLGSDSPQLTAEEIRTNLNLLSDHELSLGPAEDGGYYAIGLSRPPGELFEKVRWSGPHTLADTEEAARAMGWTVAFGPQHYDIDTFEDLNRLIRSDPERWTSLQGILNGGPSG
jgi:hypothetical protein